MIFGGQLINSFKDHCGLFFTETNSLNLHLKSHEIRSHDCKQCGKSFPKRTTLQWHVRTVHGSPIKCSCCGKFFKREQEMLKHQKELNFEKTCPFYIYQLF